MCLHALEQIADLDVGVPWWLRFTSLRLPNKRVDLVEQQNRPPGSAASNTRRRFFSVSPMYLLMTWLRSMRYRSNRR
jgi:hypothetical protein